MTRDLPTEQKRMRRPEGRLIRERPPRPGGSYSASRRSACEIRTYNTPTPSGRVHRRDGADTRDVVGTARVPGESRHFAKAVAPQTLGAIRVDDEQPTSVTAASWAFVPGQEWGDWSRRRSHERGSGREVVGIRGQRGRSGCEGAEDGARRKGGSRDPESRPRHVRLPSATGCSTPSATVHTNDYGTGGLRRNYLKRTEP